MHILTVHNLAKMYKALPSEVMAKATTFDLHVLDVSTRYMRYQQDILDGKVSDKRNNPSESEMLDMIKRARSGKK